MGFFELLRISLGNETTLTHSLTDDEWQEVYLMADKQTVVGLLLSGIERLSEEQRPPQEFLLQWIGEVLQIEDQNKIIDSAAKQLTRIFKDGGMRSCVLKGQGIARLYPKPERRQSGDVDLWVEGGRKRVLRFLKDSSFRTERIVIHHVDAQIIEGVVSEIHFIPVYACNPFLHHRLQKFFRTQADAQFSNYDKTLGFSYPTLRFNAVYVLSHIYMHFLYEGIGLRQIVDYYHVLNHLSEKEREQARIDIKEVGLNKIAGAIMFVLEKACGMDHSLIVAKVDAVRGKVLLDEIMQNGNFGRYDEELNNRNKESLIGFNMVALKRQLRFLRYYPLDVISIPFFKIGHWFWRKYNGYL